NGGARPKHKSHHNYREATPRGASRYLGFMSSRMATAINALLSAAFNYAILKKRSLLIML
ncbi:MAG: hypothetical protein ACK47L_09165, partial [Pseudanabaena sp.]